jgi:glucuronosyltransferase
LRTSFVVLCLFYTTLVTLTFPASAGRILMTPPQFESLVFMEVSVGKELIRRGHEVYIVLGSPYPKPEAILKTGMQILSYRIPSDVQYGISPEMERTIADITFKRPENLAQHYSKGIAPLFNYYCEFMMTDQKFLSQVRKHHFDVAVAVTFPLSACSLILPHYLGIPCVTIAVGMFPVPWDYGIPALPSFSELPVLKAGTVELPDLATFRGRFASTITFLGKHFIATPLMWGNTSLLERFADSDVTSWVDLLRKSVLFLDENDHHLETALPLMPHVVSIAGLTISPAKPLEGSLEQIFSESGENGIIIASFGSTASYMPSEVTKKFFDGFSRLKQTVVARFTVSDGVQVPKNVKLMSWLPQNDILGDNRTRLFITHCGSKSQYEALYHGVPMLGFPLFSEQAWNCERVRRKGFALSMDILNFSVTELHDSIRELLDNPVYSRTVKKMSQIFRDQPMTGCEKAAFWIEHVMKYGGDHLRSLTLSMPLYQFLMLDVLAVIVGVLLALLFFSVCLLRFVWMRCRKTDKPKAD